MKATPAPPFKARPGWTVHRCDNFGEMRTQAVRNWQKVSASARASAAWELVVEAWKLQNRDLNELRFQRVVTVLHKA